MFVMNYYLGIDLGGTDIKIGITGNKGNIHTKQSFPTNAHLDADTLVNHFGKCIQQVIKKSSINKKNIKGAGIGSAGLVNPETGQVKHVANIQTLSDYYLAPAIKKIIGIPVFIDNDANAMTLGEFYYGAAKGYNNIIAMTVGTGIGGGLIINGQLYRGSTFSAGELGHITIESNGIPCNCGNYGCVERYVGRESIINRFNTYRKQKKIKSTINKFLDNGEITPKAISMAAKAGDKLSNLVMKETGTYLGIALASYVNILNPEIIVIGGGIANAGGLLLKPAKEEMMKRAYPLPARNVKVVRAKLRNDAGIIGSASIAVNSLT